MLNELMATNPLALTAAALILVALTLYVVLAGADFGGGVWDLLAWGPRAAEQRKLVEKAIGPVWEANHVWLIFVVVLLFSAFPPVFAALVTALHIPLTLMLIGIVLRGCAFTFRHYDRQEDRVHRRWSYLFAVSSLITPILLGDCIGAIATGQIRVENGVVTSGFLQPWFGIFPLIVGLFTLALFALLAAVYLTLEAQEATLREDFRKRAIGAGVVVGGLAFLTLGLAHEAAPMVWQGLITHSGAMLLQALTAVMALGTLYALWSRRYALARMLAPAQIALILWGWAFAQFPYLVAPDLTILQAAAAPVVIRSALVVTAIGSLILIPSFLYLFRVFKSNPFRASDELPKKV